ncbi:alpha-E domain-containing protein [Paenibacillus beijingensis]|uniref:DUF403 domain-containing protein n=1 Tax=Paenibacillus beijingensis TaxID=1126833 RepID=A0A0D5NKS6_9BACL|nr:alpha-E domain-containing protein [Paenibacillus beijingensis]AJY75856.1 hypothetical protein VN24_16445 [Paenibacillus beijingensis]
MLNRNAEALFWTGRYMERAENHARLIDVHYHLQRDLPEGDEPDGLKSETESQSKWARVVDALGSRNEYEQQYGGYREEDVLRYVTMDRDNSNSLVSCVSHARANVRTLREKVPGELWDTVNGFYLWLREKQETEPTPASPHQFFRRIKEWTALFQGYAQSVMPRENEWHFLEAGRYLERTENTLRILQAIGNAVPGGDWSSPEAYPYLQAVLKSVSGNETFRRNHGDGLSVDAIMEFVVLHPVFPRSVHYSLHAMDRHLCGIELPEKQLRSAHIRVIRQVAKVKADLACLEQEDLVLDKDGQIVAHLLDAAGQLGLTVAKTYFRLGEASA